MRLVVFAQMEMCNRLAQMDRAQYLPVACIDCLIEEPDGHSFQGRSNAKRV